MADDPNPDEPDGDEARDDVGDVSTTSPLDKLLRRRNPFEGVFEHAQKVSEVVGLLEEGFDRYTEGDYEGFHALTEHASRLEHEADSIKANVRAHLPKFVFMPVSKADLEELLHVQDHVPDQVENLLEMLDARHTPIPPDLRPGFQDLARLAVETVRAYEAAVAEFHDVLDAGFGGHQRDEAKRAIKVVHELEYEADQIRFRLVREIYAMEDQLDPMDEYHLLKITDWLDNVADDAENAADKIRAMIAK